MTGKSKVAASIGLVAAAIVVGAGPALADSDPGPGGIGSNVSSSNATDHSGACNGGYLLLNSPAYCRTSDTAYPDGRRGARIGGLLSNLSSVNADGHSNACGNGYIAINSPTTCIVEHH
jgi:hypothetical protein